MDEKLARLAELMDAKRSPAEATFVRVEKAEAKLANNISAAASKVESAVASAVSESTEAILDEVKKKPSNIEFTYDLTTEETEALRGPKGDPGEPGADADEEEIIDRVIPEVLKAVPTADEVAALVSVPDPIPGPPGAPGLAGKDGTEVTPDQVVDKVNASSKKISKERVEFDGIASKEDLDFAIGVLDKRTQFLIHKKVVKTVNGSEPDSEGNVTVTTADVAVKVSANDTTGGYLNGKLVAGTGITLTENSDGGDETLEIDCTVVATPGGADTQVQFNTGGAFDGDEHFTYDKTNDVLHVHKIAGDATDGLILESANGTDVGLFGAANTANVAWYGAHNFSSATQDTIAAFVGAGKTLSSLAVATYPSLTELSYVKGVTSAIQAQLNGKQAAGTYVTGATDATLTLTGTTLGLSLGNANTWTALQTSRLTTKQGQWEYDASNYVGLTVGSTGHTTLTPTGSAAGLTVKPGTDADDSFEVQSSAGARRVGWSNSKSQLAIGDAGYNASFGLVYVYDLTHSFKDVFTVYKPTWGSAFDIHLSTLSPVVKADGGSTFVSYSQNDTGTYLYNQAVTGSTFNIRNDTDNYGTYGLYAKGYNNNSAPSVSGVAKRAVSYGVVGEAQSNATGFGGAGLRSYSASANVDGVRADVLSGQTAPLFRGRLVDSFYDPFMSVATDLARIEASGSFWNRLTTTQQQWEYDGSNYANITVGSAGAVTFDAVGASAGFSFSDPVTATQLTSSGLTAGRVTFAGTAGILTDDADFTFATDTLTVTKIAATTLTGTLTFADAVDVALNGTTGTKLGTATSQKLGFWNAAPIVQPTTAIAESTFVENAGGVAVNDDSTFDGYTLGQVVKALRNAGLLA